MQTWVNRLIRVDPSTSAIPKHKLKTKHHDLWTLHSEVLLADKHQDEICLHLHRVKPCMT